MLYRKVYCSERLPTNDRDGKYIMTEMGFMFFHAGTENTKWRFTKTLYDLEDWEFPAYWFEEVKGPTEEEIEDKAIAHPTPKIDNINLVAHESYTDGYKQALRDLNSEQ